MNRRWFAPIPHDAIALARGVHRSEHPGRRLWLLDLYDDAHRVGWVPIRCTVRAAGVYGLTKHQADRFLQELVDGGFGALVVSKTGKRADGTRLRLFDPNLSGVAPDMESGTDRTRNRTRKPAQKDPLPPPAEDGFPNGPKMESGTTRDERLKNNWNQVNGREPATLPPGLLGAATQARMRLKLAGTADHGAWKGLAGEALEDALHATDQELATRCQRAGVTAAELDQAVTDYRGRWYPRAEELVDLVDAARRSDRARARHHEDELDLAGERAQIDLPDPAPDEPSVAPDLDAWAGVLEGLRVRIGSQDVEVWFRPIEPLSIGSVLYLRVPNRYYSEWIESSYRDDLAAEVLAAYGRAVPVQWTWEPEAVLS